MAAELWRHNSRAARCRYRAIWRLPVSGSSCPPLHISTKYLSIWGIISCLHFYRQTQKSVWFWFFKTNSLMGVFCCLHAYNIWIFSFRGEGKEPFPHPHIIIKGRIQKNCHLGIHFPSISFYKIPHLNIFSLVSELSPLPLFYTSLSLIDCSQSLSYFVLSQAGSTPYPARQ